MSSRDAILDALRCSKPPEVPPPQPAAFALPAVDLVAYFKGVIHEIGAEAVEVAADEVASALGRAYPRQTRLASTVPEYVAGKVSLEEVRDPHDLAGLELLVCKGSLGVAENGAIWLSESQMVHRAAPFLTQHLALILEKERIVWNMHEAYARLQVDAAGYGVFIAGPSKTADIEQALVIGAHGPRSLTVLLLA